MVVAWPLRAWAVEVIASTNMTGDFILTQGDAGLDDLGGFGLLYREGKALRRRAREYGGKDPPYADITTPSNHLLFCLNLNTIPAIHLFCFFYGLLPPQSRPGILLGFHFLVLQPLSLHLAPRKRPAKVTHRTTK